MGDEPAVSTSAEVEQAEPEPPPEVRYGFSVKPRVEHLGRESTPVITLPGAALYVTGSWSASDREEQLREDSTLDRDWTAGLRASIDLGFAQLDAHADYGHMENVYGMGDYTDLGVSLTKWFRITDGVAGFVSLSVSQRDWRGDPPPGELDALTLLLSFGIRW